MEKKGFLNAQFGLCVTGVNPRAEDAHAEAPAPPLEVIHPFTPEQG